MSKPAEERIVEVLIKDLAGRRGIGDEWDQVDSATRDELRSTWAKKIRTVLDSDEPK